MATFANAQSPDPALAGNFLPSVLASSAPHRDSLVALIKGKQGLPSWVRNMVRQPRYVALASQQVEVAGKPMQVFEACEAKRCEESRIRVLYSADGKRTLLRVSDVKLGEKIFGQPSAGEMRALGL
ncbi:Ivy family c-type lysozyme inhibitor [Rhizobium sp. 18065]|uniref:Ivy family c-type lysozyme inhibitor n=1 Tax=Rhizobium sp. 18065 TaxID=2681411 RepID=UPI001FCEC8F2|nr:Ivy family c-type lysozyme inhibitor [Rhizobium sp. 18065]